MIEGEEEGLILTEINFNIRIGELDSIETKEGGYERSSKDTVIGNEARKFMDG